MTRFRTKSVLFAVLAMTACDAASKALLDSPRADKPTPAPILPVPFKLAFAPPFARGIILLPTVSAKLELIFVSDVGDTTPARGRLSFVARSPQVATVDSQGTITAHSLGSTWVVASLGPFDHILKDSISVTVRCTLELSTDFAPPSATLHVGESFVPTLELWTCQRLVKIEDAFWWRSHPPNGVIHVDSASGKTTALAPGQAFVIAMGQRGNAWGSLPVTVLER